MTTHWTKIALTAVLFCSTQSLTHADDPGFLQRFSPTRYFKRQAVRQERTPADLDQLRAKLEARGIDPAKIDARMDAITKARAEGKLPQQPATRKERTTRRREALQGFDADTARTRLEQRGLDSATIDARIARLTAAQQKAADYKTAVESGAAPAKPSFDADRFRARMEARGFDAAQIDARMSRIQARAGNR